MEELDKKLQTKDSTISTFIISKLIEYIREEIKNEKKDILELSFLKLKCVSHEPINEIAAVGLLELLEDGIISSSKLLEEFITLIPPNKISPGIVKVISGILYYQCLKEKGNQKFNLENPRHPFITLLNNDADCLSFIYTEIRFGCTTQNTSMWDMLHYPFYQYCLCNPVNKKPSYFKGKLWTNIIQTSLDTKIITKLISWMIFDSTYSILITSELLNELSFHCWRNPNKANCQIILPIQFTVLYHLVSRGYDPRNTLENIELLMGNLSPIDFTNPILLILAEIIVKSSPLNVLEILKICQLLICQPNVNYFILESIKVSLIHWMGNPSNISSQIVAKATEIYIFIGNFVRDHSVPDNFRVFYETYQDFIVSNQELYMACKLTLLCESWKNRDSILNYLVHLKEIKGNLTKRVIHLVFGLFVCNLSKEVTLVAFEIICSYLEKYNKFKHLILTLFLYKLSNSSDANIHFKVLKCLPRLAGIKENYFKVVTTIKALFVGSDVALKSLAMTLMSDLWITNKKSYIHLEDMLTSMAEENLENRWEFYVNKAHIIKNFCEKNPEVYGKEMVAHLSRILTKCSGHEGDLASAISLDAISILCKAGIIDVPTTWATLAPKYVSDRRIQTTKSFCRLASVVPSVLQMEDNTELFKEIICILWKYVTENQEVDVKIAALDALIEFGFENISPYFPEDIFENEEEFANKPLLVPGDYWVRFLKNQTSLEVSGNFVIKLMGTEIDQYLKSVYHVSSSREPINYSYLPSHSIVRGVGQYCKLQARNWNGLHKQIYIECLRILSQPYSKPLPPYNWNYLEMLSEEPDLKNYVIDLASHQVMISGTARRLMENFINKLTDDLEDKDSILMVYKNLKFLANSIQPIILEPFIKNTLNNAKNLFQKENNKELMNTMTDYLKNILADQTIQEANKTGVVTTITEMFQTTDVSEEIFNVLMDCIIKFPPNSLENITKLNSADTSKDLNKITKLRCFLAQKHKDKLKWLNDSIDLCGKERFECPLMEIQQVFQQQHKSLDCSEFTFDLLGRIEATLPDRHEKSNIVLLLNILIIAVVTFSGFHIFTKSTFKLSEYVKLFPQSTVLLLGSKDWSNYSTKMMECFYYLNTSRKISSSLRNMFGQTLQALRHHPDFKKSNKWMKYLNCNIELETYL